MKWIDAWRTEPLVAIMAMLDYMEIDCPLKSPEDFTTDLAGKPKFNLITLDEMKNKEDK